MKKSKIFLTFLLGLVLSVKVHAQSEDYRFHKVYFYNFTRYIEWPETYKQGDFVIGVLGDCPIIPTLEEMAKIKSAGTQRFRVEKLNKISSQDKVQIFFLPRERSQDLAKVLEAYKGKPTLIVTDQDGLIKQGSMINFVQRNGRLMFEINPSAIEAKGLKVSKELIRFGIDSGQ